jgi:Ser/Thr protein kinase RdoA (MazF antagonist)
MPWTAASADASRELAEYDVGDLLSAAPLPAGSQSARQVTTTRGSYLLKPAYRAADVELQAHIAPLLTARRIRQPRVVPTAAGGLVTCSGFVLLEWLPGAVALEPAPQQTTAAMRHIGAFHAELGLLAPAYQADPDTVWSRCADPGFLVAELPGLLARHGPGDASSLGDASTEAALDLLRHSAADLGALPRQVVHGDIGPDNVLMNGDEVIALIDFTPYWEPVLFAACGALYWYHVYGRHAASADRLASSLTAIGAGRPWQADELALWPAGLVREALRRLAIPLALADRDSTDQVPRVERRLAAVRAVVRVLPELSAGSPAS